MSAHVAASGYRVAARAIGPARRAQRGGREREHNEERATMGVWCNEPIMRMGTPVGVLLFEDAGREGRHYVQQHGFPPRSHR